MQDFQMLKLGNSFVDSYLVLNKLSLANECSLFYLLYLYSVRCQVPDDMLRSGFEPIKVVGDGNCLFRSLCMVVYGNDEEHQWMKLWCIVFGCLQEDHYVKQVNAIKKR